MKKYWVELLVFWAIFAVLMICNSPAYTWMNTDSDGAHYVLAAKYLTTAHHMSAPLYLLLGNLFLRIPIGTEFWRMGLMSVFATVGACIFIYFIVLQLLKDNPKARMYAVISALIYGSSALVISQSTIVETYTLSTMCGVGAYYFVLRKNWLWASVILGLGLAIHPFLSFIVWAVLFASYKEMRSWKRYMLTIAFFSFYLYIPIVGVFGEDSSMWANTSSEGFFGGTLGMVFMLTGGLSVWDFPKRVIDTISIVVVSFGLGIIPLVWYFMKEKRWRSSLLWLVLIPIGYFAINLAAETYVYMVVAVAFGSIVVGLGLSKMNAKWVFAVTSVACLLLGYNFVYFDIGRTLDSEMSAVKFYEEELSKIPDGDYFMAGGWTWAMTYVYNKEEGRNIIPISMDALPSMKYRKELSDMGVKYDSMLLPLDSDMSYITTQGKLALSIASMNEGVWIAKETKPEVYQYVIEPAKGNESYIGRWIGDEATTDWKWKPSNPWKFISGKLEISEWHHVLWVRNPTGLGQMLFIIVFGIYGYGAFFLTMRMLKKRKKGKRNGIPESK